MSEYGSYDVPSAPDDRDENVQPPEHREGGDVSTIDFSMAPTADDAVIEVVGVDPVLGLPFWHPDAVASPMTALDGDEGDYELVHTDGTHKKYREVLSTYIDGSPIPKTDDRGAEETGSEAASDTEMTADSAEQPAAPPIEEPFYIPPEERTYLPEQWRTSKEDLMGYDEDLGYGETYQNMDREKLKETLKPVAAAEQDDPLRNVRREQDAEAEAEAAEAAEVAAVEAKIEAEEAEAAAAKQVEAEEAAAEKTEAAAAEVDAEVEAAAAAERLEAEQLAAEAAIVAEAEEILAASATEAVTDTHDEMPEDINTVDGGSPLVPEGSEDELTAVFASEPITEPLLDPVLDPAEAEAEGFESSGGTSLSRMPDEIERLREFIEGSPEDATTYMEETPGIPTRPPGSQYTLNPDGSFSVAGPVPDVADLSESGSSEDSLGGNPAELTNVDTTAMPDITRDSGFGDRSVEDGFAPSRAASADVGVGSAAGATDLVDSPNVGDVAPAPQGAGLGFDANTASTDLGPVAIGAIEGQDVPGSVVGASPEAAPALPGESDQAQSAALASPDSSSPPTAAPAQGSGAQPDSDPTSSDGDPTAAQVTAQSSGSDSDPSAGPATSQPSTSQQSGSRQAGQDDSASQPASAQQRVQTPRSDDSQQSGGDPLSSRQQFRFSASAAAAAAKRFGRYVTYDMHPAAEGDTALRVADGIAGIIASIIRSPARVLGLNTEITAKPVETIFGNDGPLYEVVVKDKDTGSMRVSKHRVLAPSAAVAKLMVQLTIPHRDIMG